MKRFTRGPGDNLYVQHGDIDAVEVSVGARGTPGGIGVGRFTGDLADGVKFDISGRDGLLIAGVFLTCDEAHRLVLAILSAVSQEDDR